MSDPSGKAADTQKESGRMTFLQRHAGHPALQSEAVYALPHALIRAIQEYCPGLWTTGEINFEKELTDSTGHGLFLNQPFAFRWLNSSNPIPEDPELAPLLEQQKINDAKVRKLLTSEITESGRAPLVAERQFESEVLAVQKTTDRQRGYAGWLVTEPLFRIDVRNFRDKWRG